MNYNSVLNHSKRCLENGEGQKPRRFRSIIWLGEKHSSYFDLRREPTKQIRDEVLMRKENHENSDKHESVNNLPFIKRLKSSASGLEWLGRLLRNDEVRKSGREVREELDGLVSLIDDFYYLLGNRNWVFSDALEPERMRAVVSKPTPEEAERELIEYLKEEEVLHRMITRLNRFPDMRPRIPLLKKAEQDYLQGPRDGHRDGRIRERCFPVRREEGPPCEGVRRAPCGRLRRDRVGWTPVHPESLHEINPREDR